MAKTLVQTERSLNGGVLLLFIENSLNKTMSHHSDQEGKEGLGSIRDQWMRLPPDVQAIVDERMLEYYEDTNEMRMDRDKPGGSKFESAEDGGVDSIFQVIERMGYDEFVRRVMDREDDRERLIEAGAPESAFLPAERTEDTPEGLPEALYFMVEGIRGELGIVQLAELDPDTVVVVERAKGRSNPDEPETYAAASITTFRETLEELPETDFATVIVGREPGKDNQLWTIHPGAPIRPALRDFVWSQGLKGPEELAEGEAAQAIITTVARLLEAGMATHDYIKISVGDADEYTANHDTTILE